jgi:predicted lipid carrier protein YhbT
MLTVPLYSTIRTFKAAGYPRFMNNTSTASQFPPFSPMLFAGLALRPLPTSLMSRLLALFVRRVNQLHPEISTRLTPLGQCQFHIIPTDFHFSFLINLDHGQTTVKVLGQKQRISEPTASISGDMLSFIQLLEGRVDGDALFFSRRLIVEGDTEAVLTLRNAVDSADLSIEGILSGLAGPFRPLIERAIFRISPLRRTMRRDFDLVHRSLTGPYSRRISQFCEDLDVQEKRILQQEKEIRKLKAARKN